MSRWSQYLRTPPGGRDVAGRAEEVLKEKASLQIGAQFCREAGRKDHEAMPLMQVTVGAEVSFGGDSLKKEF